MKNKNKESTLNDWVKSHKKRMNIVAEEYRNALEYNKTLSDNDEISWSKGHCNIMLLERKYFDLLSYFSITKRKDIKDEFMGVFE